MKKTRIEVSHQCPQDLPYHNEPRIVKGGCADWPALDKWTRAWLQSTLGAIPVPLTDNVLSPHASPIAKTHISMSDYLDTIQNQHHYPYYLAGWRYRNYYRDLENDIKIPYAFRENALDTIAELFGIEHSTLFIGHRAVDSPTHTDSHFMATYPCIVAGKKSIRLIEPTKKYDKLEIRNGVDLYSGILPDDITFYEGEIEKGDFVYIPAGWWHHVRNESNFTVAVSNNFLGPCQLPAFEQSVRLMLWKKILEVSDIRKGILCESLSLDARSAQEKYLSKGKFATFEKDYLQMLLKEVS